jgi:ATP-binding cassette, subfamily B, bacterial PglK
MTTSFTTHKIWALLTSHQRRAATILFGLMVIGMVFETLSVGMVVPVLILLSQNNISEEYPILVHVFNTLGNPSQNTLMVMGILMLVAIYLVKNVFLGFFFWRQMSFVFGVMEQLSQRLLTVYLRQPYTFHLQRNSAELMRNTFSEADLFATNVVTPIMQFLAECLVVFGLTALLFYIEPMGVLIVTGIIAASAWGFSRLTQPYIARWGVLRQHHAGLRIQHMQQGLGGVKDIKLLGREAEFLEQFRLHNQQYTRVGKLQNTLLQFPRLWLEVLAIGGLATLTITMLVLGNELSSIMPLLGLFAAAGFRLIPSVNRVLGAVQSLRYGLPVLDTLNSELNLTIQELDTDSPPVIPFRHTLEMQNVSFCYPGASTNALSDFSFLVQRGEFVGFVGTSGAGKSTLVDTLLGLLAPTTGEVKVDGIDIQVGLRNWQDQIGYVPQTIFLTDDTLRRNVAFGLPNDKIDEEAVWRAIRAAQLEEFVQSLPSGLDSMVGERGVRISGGQRQRIGIARALYHDPPVLVLDEATSALDSATERSVMQAINALHGDKTILIVAHRLSTVEICDRLYRLDFGRLVETGETATILGAANTKVN